MGKSEKRFERYFSGFYCKLKFTLHFSGEIGFKTLLLKTKLYCALFPSRLMYSSDGAGSKLSTHSEPEERELTLTNNGNIQLKHFKSYVYYSISSQNRYFINISWPQMVKSI